MTRTSDPQHFHDEIERNGLDETEAKLPQYNPKEKAVGEAVVAQYRRKQHEKELAEQVERDERAIKIAGENLTAAKKGNETQKHILWTLIATIVVSLLVAFFKD